MDDIEQVVSSDAVLCPGQVVINTVRMGIVFKGSTESVDLPSIVNAIERAVSSFDGVQLMTLVYQESKK